MTDKQKEELYRNYYGKVYGYIKSRISDTLDAEDLTSDVFVKVYENIDRFDESKASLSTWIYTITRNTLTDHYRTRKVFSEIPETLNDQNDSVEDVICDEESLEILANALESLDQRERNIIILRYYSGKTLKEIAEDMGISYAYVKVLQNGALKKIKRFFEKE